MKHARKQAKHLVTQWAAACKCPAADLAALETMVAQALFERTRKAAATMCEHCSAGRKLADDGLHSWREGKKQMQSTCWAAEIWRETR